MTLQNDLAWGASVGAAVPGVPSVTVPSAVGFAVVTPSTVGAAEGEGEGTREDEGAIEGVMDCTMDGASEGTSESDGGAVSGSAP